MLFVSSAEASEEVVAMWRQLGLTLEGARPWKEFYQVFKPVEVKKLEARMSTNLLYYKANYCQLICGVMALAILTSPRTILGILLSAGVACLLFLIKAKSLTIGETVVQLTKRNKGLASAGCALVLLVWTGALLWLMVSFSFALVVVIAHMAFRPRTLAAKYNAASDDIKHMFFGGGEAEQRSKASAEDAAEDGLAFDSSAGLHEDGLHSRRARHTYER